MTNEADQLAQWVAQATQEGRDAGTRAASWAADGNTSAEHAACMVAWLADGDPRASDYLPARPDLSGEWADAPVPITLYEEITGRDAHGDASWNQDSYQSTLEALCTAWEDGVSETFEAECERLLRSVLA